MGRVSHVVGRVSAATGVQARGATMDRKQMCCKVSYPLLAGIFSGTMGATLKAVQSYVDTEGWIEKNIAFDPTAFGTFGTCLGFLIVFRTAQSYGRFWEGIDMVYEIMGHWFNAASNALAFTRAPNSKASAKDVDDFHQLVVRLFSLLNCVVLQELEGLEVRAGKLNFTVLDLSRLDKQTRFSVLHPKDRSRPEQVYHAISKVMMRAINDGVMAAPPPVVSRVYHEMGLGMSKMHAAMRLGTVDFPAPYLFALKAMLCIYMFLTPVAVIGWAQTIAFAGFFSMLLVFAMWGLLTLAAELDNPYLKTGFSFDKEVVQGKLNKALMTILLEESRPVAHLEEATASDMLSADEFSAAEYTLEDLKLNTFDRLSQVLPGQAD
ncbi:cyb5r2 [Symbiodinium pilosum]|uniref:Cyb5r2 protein n=1 Tax=Symbiodinium pilosum TaxID=2952 RepID=A0A812X0L9_SYMPI|nr:cyb5r2 [Symbiodinium pilosum]